MTWVPRIFGILNWKMDARLPSDHDLKHSPHYSDRLDHKRSMDSLPPFSSTEHYTDPSIFCTCLYSQTTFQGTTGVMITIPKPGLIPLRTLQAIYKRAQGMLGNVQKKIYPSQGRLLGRISFNGMGAPSSSYNSGQSGERGCFSLGTDALCWSRWR